MTTDHAKAEAYALALSQAQERACQALDMLREIERDDRLPIETLQRANVAAHRAGALEADLRERLREVRGK